MSANGPRARDPRTLDPGEISLGGDEHASALLEPALAWTAARLDARFAAIVILSGRVEPISRAWGWCRPAGELARPRPEARLAEEMFAAAWISGLVDRLEHDPTLPTVFSTGAAEMAPAAAVLLESLGLSMPLTLALRSRGRIAGLLFVCRSPTTEAAPAEALIALRRFHPLVEAAFDPDPIAASVRAAGPNPVGLTPREQTIAELVLAGAGNAEIGAKLGIAETTVRNHVSRILKKHGVRSRAQLIAIEAGARDSAPVGG